MIVLVVCGRPIVAVICLFCTAFTSLHTERTNSHNSEQKYEASAIMQGFYCTVRK